MSSNKLYVIAFTVIISYNSLLHCYDVINIQRSTFVSAHTPVVLAQCVPPPLHQYKALLSTGQAARQSDVNHRPSHFARYGEVTVGYQWHGYFP